MHQSHWKSYQSFPLSGLLQTERNSVMWGITSSHTLFLKMLPDQAAYHAWLSESWRNFDGSYIIAVVDRKTIATAGAAMFSITPDLMRHLRIFVKIRKSLPGMPTGKKYPIFVSWSGQKMGPNMVTT